MRGRVDGPPVSFRTITVDVQPGTNHISIPDMGPIADYWAARALRAESQLRETKAKLRKLEKATR